MLGPCLTIAVVVVAIVVRVSRIPLAGRDVRPSGRLSAGDPNAIWLGFGTSRRVGRPVDSKSLATDVYIPGLLVLSEMASAVSVSASSHDSRLHLSFRSPAGC